MNKQVRILPGTPDDANREYLPERIKTTDIVVNENGNQFNRISRALAGISRSSGRWTGGRMV